MGQVGGDPREAGCGGGRVGWAGLGWGVGITPCSQVGSKAGKVRAGLGRKKVGGKYHRWGEMRGAVGGGGWGCGSQPRPPSVQSRPPCPPPPPRVALGFPAGVRWDTARPVRAGVPIMGGPLFPVSGRTVDGWMCSPVWAFPLVWRKPQGVAGRGAVAVGVGLGLGRELDRWWAPWAGRGGLEEAGAAGAESAVRVRGPASLRPAARGDG